MKTLNRLFMIAALAAVFAVSALAQDQPAANPCDSQEKNDLYTQYYNLKKTDQAKAYDISKQYLDKFGSCTDNYTASVKKFNDAYGTAVGGLKLRTDFFNAYNAKDYAKLTTLANQLLAADANDAAAPLLAGWGIYQATLQKNPAANTTDALNFVNKALALIQSGQEPKDLGGKVSWAPFGSKDEAMSYLNFAIASLEIKNNTDDAMTRLVQLAQGNTKLKEEPSVYSYLAFGYEQQAAPLLEKYKTFTTQTPESDLVLANFNRVIDEVIDSYARAVAYSKDDAQKTQFMTRLTELYKSRHDGAVTGLNEYVAGIKSQPLVITQPLTSLPVATPAATPASGDGTAATTTGGTTPATAPVANPAAPRPVTTTPTTTAKPPTTTTSKKPPVSKNH